MKPNKSLSIIIFSVALVAIVVFYILNSNHLKTIHHIAFLFSIFLISYLLYINISKKYFDFKRGFSLQNIAEKSDEKKRYDFLTIVLFCISMLILVGQLINGSFLNSIYVNITLIIIFIILLVIKLLKVTKHHI